jgi:hypothetical protein
VVITHPFLKFSPSPLRPTNPPPSPPFPFINPHHPPRHSARQSPITPPQPTNRIAIGYDEGTIVVKLGQEVPVASLDANTGKLVWTVNNDVFTASVKVRGEREVAGWMDRWMDRWMKE